jgi:hypothetical protein
VVLSKPRLTRVLRSGLRVAIMCSDRCRARAAARVDRPTARRLRLGRRATTVAHRSVPQLRAGERSVVTLSFTKQARQRLRRLRAAVLTVAVDLRSGGTTTTRSRRVVLRRSR